MDNRLSQQLREALTLLYKRDKNAMDTVAALYDGSITIREAGGQIFGSGAKLDQKVSCFLLLVAEKNEEIANIVGELIEEIPPRRKRAINEVEPDVEKELRKSCRCVAEEKLGIPNAYSPGATHGSSLKVLKVA